MVKQGSTAALLLGGVAALAAVAGCAASVAGTGSAQSPSASSPSASGSNGPATVYRTATNTIAASAPVPSSPAGAGSSSSAATLVMPSDFVGDWGGHGRSLTITAGGTLTMSYRTYTDCTATITTGCDKIVGNEINDGGSMTAQLTQVINPTTVMVTVTASSVPSIVPLGTARLGFDRGHDALALFTGVWADAPFCGSRAPSGYCGA